MSNLYGLCFQKTFWTDSSSVGSVVGPAVNTSEAVWWTEIFRTWWWILRVTPLHFQLAGQWSIFSIGRERGFLGPGSVGQAVVDGAALKCVSNLKCQCAECKNTASFLWVIVRMFIGNKNMAHLGKVTFLCVLKDSKLCQTYPPFPICSVSYTAEAYSNFEIQTVLF